MQSTNQEHQEQNLQERVFQICENLYRNNEKINRDVVREHLGGGSFTHISPLVKEWKELNKQKLVQNNDDQCTNESTESNLAFSENTDIENAPEELNATEINVNTDFTSDNDLNQIIRSGAEKAAGTLIAQEALALHFYQNPDQLPLDLKAKVEEMRGNFSQSRSQASKIAMNPQNLINKAMKKMNQATIQKQNELELIG